MDNLGVFGTRVYKYLMLGKFLLSGYNGEDAAVRREGHFHGLPNLRAFSHRHFLQSEIRQPLCLSIKGKYKIYNLNYKELSKSIFTLSKLVYSIPNIGRFL
jgi:hypothetical protein